MKLMKQLKLPDKSKELARVVVIAGEYLWRERSKRCLLTSLLISVLNFAATNLFLCAIYKNHSHLNFCVAKKNKRIGVQWTGVENDNKIN